MNCNDCLSQLELYILGELEPSDAESVSRHLDSGCVSCREALQAFDESIDCLIEATPLVSPRSATWDRVAAAIDASQGDGSQGDAGESERHAFQVNRVIVERVYVESAIGLLAIACGFGLMLFTLRATLDGPLSRPNDHDLAARTGVVPGTRSPSTVFRDSSPSESSNEESKLVSFREPDAPTQVAGSMFVDMNAKQLHVSVKLDGSYGYQFWFVTNDGEWVEGGSLNELTPSIFGNVLDIPVLQSPIAYTVITFVRDDRAAPSRPDIAVVSDGVVDFGRRAL